MRAGRCSPEKGLHFYLDALAVLRRTRDVTLTAVCAAGPDDYRESIHGDRAAESDGRRRALLPCQRESRVHLAAHDVVLFIRSSSSRSRSS